MKVLLATPVKGPIDLGYHHGIVHCLMNPIPGVEIIPAVTVGTYINWARNDLVVVAASQKCDRILYVDSDMAFGAPEVERILSHDVDIVSGQYCKRKPGEPEWLAKAVDGAVPDDNGLMEATQLPAGFLCVKMSVFDTMFAKLPQRRYRTATSELRCEYFPLALTERDGWRHPAEVKLAEIRAMVARGVSAETATEILAICQMEVECSPVGEDTAFSRLARVCGIKMYVDEKLNIRHVGSIGFPAFEL